MSLPDRGDGPAALRCLSHQLPGLMDRAIALARSSDRPFGCLIVVTATGRVLAEGSNGSTSDPTAHAEIAALRCLFANAHRIETKALTLISTAEPCPMCASACWWANLGGIVWGTSIASLIASGWHQLDLSCQSLLETGRPQRTIATWPSFANHRTDPLYASGPS